MIEKNKMKTIFTGQQINEHEEVKCTCGKLVSVRVGWIDKYQNGHYVHFGCLSKKRIEEINRSVE